MFEAAVAAQFGACPGVEVVPRGLGFLAGRYGGKIVLVSGEGTCTPFKTDKGEAKVNVTVSWRSVEPGSTETIAVLRRSVILDQASCPSDYSDAALQAPFIVPNHRVCSEGFVPLRQPFSLANLLVPMLSPIGIVRSVAGAEGREALTWDINGRTVQFDGTATCMPASNDLEPFGQNLMASWMLQLDLQMTDAASRQRLGQWRENYVQALGISCDSALSQSANRSTLTNARELWEQRFFDAVQRSTP